MRVCKQCGISIEGKISSAVYCSKSCKSKARYEANKKEILAHVKAWREANRDKVLAQSKAYYEANRDKLLARRKARYEANKDKVLAQQKTYREANPEKVSAYRKARYEANKDKVSAQHKAWYEANKGKELAYQKAYREANPEKRKAQVRTWKEANPEKVRVQKQRRRARKRALPAEFTKEQWRNALNYFDHKCAYCDKPLKRAHQEHFIPLSKGGAYTKDNIVPSCPSCNASKGDKNPAEWLFESREFIEATVRYTKITRYLRGL